jgi:hypothetical protein
VEIHPVQMYKIRVSPGCRDGPAHHGVSGPASLVVDVAFRRKRNWPQAARDD